MRLDKYSYSYIGLLVFHTVVLLFIANDFSISYKESLKYFDDSNILYYITYISTNIFGNNNFALRLPFVLFYTASSILFYNITDGYFRHQWDRVIALSIFMVLPGVNSSALLVNESIVVIFFTLIYLYSYKVTKQHNYFLLFLFLFVDNSFAILFLSLFIYSLNKKDNKLLVISLILFGLSMSIYGFDMGGRPRGYFIDTFGMYATIFSPILFIYFFYSIYRVGIHFKKDIYWYIAITALMLSFIFSLRQKIDIADFAPFTVIAVPIMVKLFMHSIRVRLKEFRKVEYSIAVVSIVILVLNFFVLVFNKQFYRFMDDPSKHFIYKYHTTQELAMRLKDLGIEKIDTKNKQLQQKLKYYGIEKGEDLYLSEHFIPNCEKTITIKYYGKLIKRYYIYRADMRR